MIRVVFVDDEVAILEGLQNRLRKFRKRWKMRFYSSGRDALEGLEAEPADVVVSDMRMPGMDGATLLRALRQEYPGTGRILLTGYAEAEQLLRALPVADKVLTKPCEVDQLDAAISNTYAVQQSVSDPEVREIVGRVENLPSLPDVYRRLEAAITAASTSDAAIASIIEHDVVLSARTLQVANALCEEPIDSVARAVQLLGNSSIKALVLSVGLFDSVAARMQVEGFSLEQLERRGVLAGRIARSLVDDPSQRDAAFSAALLHDIGRLVLAAHAPDRYARAREMSRSEGIAFHEAEDRLFGVTHGHVGGHLLTRWGITTGVIEAVTFHHTPSLAYHADFGVLGATHIATWLAGWVEHDQQGATMDPDVPLPTLDPAYVSALDLEDRLDDWRTLALEEAKVEVPV